MDYYETCWRTFKALVMGFGLAGQTEVKLSDIIDGITMCEIDAMSEGLKGIYKEAK